MSEKTRRSRKQKRENRTKDVEHVEENDTSVVEIDVDVLQTACESIDALYNEMMLVNVQMNGVQPQTMDRWRSVLFEVCEQLKQITNALSESEV